MKHQYLLSALLLVLLAACAPSPGPTPMVVVVVVTATPEASAPQPESVETQPPSQPAPTAVSNQHTIPSSTAGEYAGQTVTVRIERAWCSYQQQIKGNPTFCNDQPYPGHDFTLVFWGEDWSDYDGLCLLVNGMVTRYQGKAQIVAESREQVKLCR